MDFEKKTPPPLKAGTSGQASQRSEVPSIPPGFVQCAVCGQYNGSTDAENLSWPSGNAPTGKMSVTCLCHGIPCPRCKTRLINRPVSNTYDPASNSIDHWPYFAGLRPCGQCRAEEKTAKKE